VLDHPELRLGLAQQRDQPSNTSAATDDLLRQQLQRLVERRHLAVGRRDAGLDGARRLCS
jgi:hypothetical protein